LPSGERLEAHSGLGSLMDDPRYVHEKNRGATPPNTYALKLRESLFHGVQAVRLTPMGDGNMFNHIGVFGNHDKDWLFMAKNKKTIAKPIR
jgi:hypothetical protein